MKNEILYELRQIVRKEWQRSRKMLNLRVQSYTCQFIDGPYDVIVKGGIVSNRSQRLLSLNVFVGTIFCSEVLRQGRSRCIWLAAWYFRDMIKS